MKYFRLPLRSRFTALALSALFVALGFASADAEDLTIQLASDKVELDNKWKHDISENLPDVDQPGIFFNGHPKVAAVKFIDGADDWSNYGSATFRIYSQQLSTAELVIVIRIQGTENLFWQKVTADWEGWKDINFITSGFNPTQKKDSPPLGSTFGKVERIDFQNFGFGASEESKNIAHAWAIDSIIVNP